MQPNNLEHLHSQDWKIAHKIGRALNRFIVERLAAWQRRGACIRLAAVFLLVATACTGLPFWPLTATRTPAGPTLQPGLISATSESGNPQSSENAGSPSSTGGPLSTLTLSPDFTLTARATLAKTIQTTPTPESSPEGTTTPLPGVTSDLVFLADGRLASWNHASGRISVLAMNVVDYSLNANGQGIAILRTKGVAANGITLYDLVFMEVDSRQSTVLEQNSPRLFNILISPDSLRIAYTSQEQGGSIYLTPSNSAGQSVKIGTCAREHELVCDANITWSPDSSELLWSDQQGIWLADVEADPPHLAAPSKIKVTDPKGEQTEITVSFTNLAWSPAGRYVLAEVSPIPSEVHWQSLVDTRLGRISEIPDTYEYVEHTVKTAWLPDGSLFVAQRGDGENHRPPHAALWQVVDTRDNLVSLKKEFDFSSDSLTQLVDLGARQEDLAPDWVTALNERLLGLGIRVKEMQVSPLLFTFDLKYGALQEINEIPYDVEFSPLVPGYVWSVDHRTER